MRLRLIACEVFCREFCGLLAHSEHVFRPSFQEFGLHDRPDDLRQALQSQIDSVPEGDFDFILLGYGLCSRGTAGLVARQSPIVLPRSHDCIAFLLGSRQAYRQQFDTNPGTYYYSSGWIERNAGSLEQSHLQAAREEEKRRRFLAYKEKYGEDNALFLIEQESQWILRYSRAAYIDLPFGNRDLYRLFTQGVAKQNGWAYEEIQGDMGWMSRFLKGEWEEGDFLMVEPGQRVAESYDERIVVASPA